MDTARKSKSIDDYNLRSLENNIKTLERESRSSQQKFERQHDYYANRCQKSLQDSMKSLFDVINYVRKTDKKLIDWHDRGDWLKTALRPFGVDNRTNVVIDKRTQELQKKVQRAETKFGNTGNVLNGGLKGAERMKEEVNNFSAGPIKEISQKALMTLDTYTEQCERADTIVKGQIAKFEGAQSEAESLTKSMRHAGQRYENAEWYRSALTKSTIAGMGASALSAVLFPPTLLVTGGLLAASAVAGSSAFSYDQEMQNLQSLKASLAGSLSRHGLAIQALEIDLAKSMQNRKAHSEAVAEAEVYICKTSKIKEESEQSLNVLRTAEVVLNKFNSKVESIKKDLHDCRYEESRRGIAGRLRDVMGMIGDVPKDIKSAKEKDINMAMRALAEIDERTMEVLMIAHSSKEAGVRH